MFGLRTGRSHSNYGASLYGDLAQSPFSAETLEIDPQEDPNISPPASEVGSTQDAEEASGRWVMLSGFQKKKKPRMDDPKAEIFRLKGWVRRHREREKAAQEHIVELNRQLEENSRLHAEETEKQNRRIRAMEDDLARAKELSAAKSAELTVAQPFLSTIDNLPEADVLGIVRDLNENIFQVAANLAEEWEKYRSSRSSRVKISDKKVEEFSEAFGPVLVDQTIGRDPAAVTYLVQTCLCSFVTHTTTAWRRGDSCDEELYIIGEVYQRLVNTEGQATSSRWKSLTHRCLPEPESQFDSLVNSVAGVMWLTGSFSPLDRSLDFVRGVASSGIETIDKLSMRLESVFMVDIASSDMYLLYGTPHVEFDDTRMADELESGRTSSRTRGKIAGTTEVGLGKIVGGKKGERHRKEVLLKVKVVLERDLTVSSRRSRVSEVGGSHLGSGEKGGRYVGRDK